MKVEDTNESSVNDISDVDFTSSIGGGDEGAWITITAPEFIDTMLIASLRVMR